MNKLTADTITDDQIRALQTEASDAGDIEQADLCSLALGYTPLIAWNLTPYAARIRCVAAINEARAQADLEPCPRCCVPTAPAQQHGIVLHADESGDGRIHNGGCDACCSCTDDEAARGLGAHDAT